MKHVSAKLKPKCLTAKWMVALTMLLWAQPLRTVHAQERPVREGASSTAFFENRIHPVLVARCYECHSRQAAEVEGGLLLDSREGMQSGGDSGPAVVPGNEQASLLLKAITSLDNPMPPDDRLSSQQIDDFRAWIAAGAIDPRQSGDEPQWREPDYTQARDYWAFLPVTAAAIPVVQDPSWPTNSIDHFILAKLEQQGLSPAPRASPESLIRRLFFDLTGLPPTPKQIDDFARDPSDQVYRRIVDQLLDSPQYGERAAQHWLDVIRYAETEGFEYDRLMPGMWRYRDYVIASFNADKPYDQFLLEQLAGDELDPNDAELQIAAGFHRLGAVRRNAGNQKVASSRNEVLTERTDIVGSLVLGLTIGCARCHDHKFDPIPQQDYYRLQAYFAASQEYNISLRDEQEQQRLLALTESLEKQIDALKETLSGLGGEEEQRVRSEIQRLEQQLPPAGPTLCSIRNDFEGLAPVHVLRRGDPELAGPVVGMRMLGVIASDGQPELPPDTRHPRTTLARQLVAPNHPLTARVIVNRVWLQHFGSGLVRTPNDFGRNGATASHPELLDYLAATFVADGWHFKALHRTIVTSSTYRQSSRVGDARVARRKDAENRLLWHFPRRRLSGEEVRDAMLSVAGKLNLRMGGESVVLPVEQELVDQLYKPTQWQVSQDPAEHYRRSIYLLAKRNLRLPFMEVFDQPSTQTSCAVREQSTHARQALELLNGPLANQLSSQLAQRLRRETGDDRDASIQRAFRLTTGRRPLPREQAIAEQLLAEVGLEEFALAMFNLNAFLYVD